MIALRVMLVSSLALTLALALAGTARAGGSDDATSETSETSESRPPRTEALDGLLQRLSMECRQYAWIPADARDDILGWNQLLSLAACLQDSSITPVRNSDELTAMVDAYVDALEVPMMIYFGALENGPGPIQLRAAYHIAMLHLTLIVRARSSIVAPSDLTTNPDAARRDSALHAELEELIAPSAWIAWKSLDVIVRATEADPSLAPDPVTQNMVRSARAMLATLPRPTEQRNDARTLARSHALAPIRVDPSGVVVLKFGAEAERLPSSPLAQARQRTTRCQDSRASSSCRSTDGARRPCRPSRSQTAMP